MSCLFNSISRLIGINSNTIRQTICDYLEQGHPIMEGLDTFDILKIEQQTIEKYIRLMRQTNTWGGAIEISAACNIWKCRIIVENRRDRRGNIEFIPISVEPQKTLVLYWTGGHYEPVRIL
jgi:hypothetical protein